MLLWLTLALLILAMAVPRLLPVEAARWHLPIAAEQDADLPNGAIRVISQEVPNFANFAAAFDALPRTERIAGSIDEGRITYQTRSLVFGFPDYTTIERSKDQIRLYARQRIGKLDMGVNRKRLEQVLATLQL